MRIVMGVDGSAAARTAGEFVASRTWPVGTRVTLVAAVESILALGGVGPTHSDQVQAVAVLDERAQALRRAGLAVETAVELGPASEVLMRHADAALADLIVVGSRGLGAAASAILGSVSAYLVDHATCPVLVVRSPSATRMLLASDGTRSSLDIPRVLAGWGPAFRGLPVEVVTVAPRERFITPWAAINDEADGELAEHEAIAHEVADQLMELGWHAAATVRTGEPSRQIVEEGRQWHADLIVTGSRGIGTLRRLLGGSVAHDVLLHARSSILVVRGQVPAPIVEPARAIGELAPS